MVYTSCLTNTERLKIKKNQENLKTYDNYKLVPSLPDKMKVILILDKNLEK